MLRVIEAVVAFQLCSVAYALGTNLALINLTPYKWQQSKAPHAYQISDWVSSFNSASAVNSASIAKATVTVDASAGPGDCAADVSYQVTDDATGTMDIRFRADSFVQFATLPSAEHVEVGLVGISTSGNTKGSNPSVGFNAGGWTPIILGGKKDSFVGNNPPQNWMSVNKNHLGCLSLSQLMIAGSHDAGMSKIQHSTGFSNPANTQTQTHSIYDQLVYGIRYFDIRPASQDNVYYTGHWTNAGSVLGWQGSMGQSIDDVIQDVNKFTSQSGNNELIILYLSHTVSVDQDHKPFNDTEWNAVSAQLSKGLKYLYQNSSGNSLTSTHLNTFIANGPSVVLVNDERDVAWLKQNNLFGKGHFAKSQYTKYDSYSSTDSPNDMRADQYKKLTTWAADTTRSKDQVFLLSWTMTLTDVETANLNYHLTDLADSANKVLYEVSSGAPQVGVVQWVDFKKGVLPNVVLIDNVKDSNLPALMIAMNRYYYECNGAT